MNYKITLHYNKLASICQGLVLDKCHLNTFAYFSIIMRNKKGKFALSVLAFQLK